MLAGDRQQADHWLKVGLDKIAQVCRGCIRKSKGNLPSCLQGRKQVHEPSGGTSTPHGIEDALNFRDLIKHFREVFLRVGNLAIHFALF